jgi:serine/threonine protein kinase
MIETGKLLQQRYRIDKQIGQGGMGAVYIATDERFGSTVAIKETLFMDDNYRKAIEREARLLNSLRHPALPRVSDHFEEDNGQFLVMEYIPGEDLSQMMETGEKPFPVDQVLTWADQLLDALEFLHTQSMPVVHRDIKPQNLKLTARGQIILLDFGLAKGNPTDAGHQTAAKSIFGYSRNYASLEQIQGTGTDPRSDLYSLAATLYHLLTGVPPEDALTRAMAVLSKRPDPLMPANGVRPEIPAGVAGVLQNALDLNAEGRPTTAAEMRSMLREHEKYAYLADPVEAGAITPTADVLAQRTKLMAADTRHVAAGQTDVKTQLMSPVISQETSVRTGGAGVADTHSEPMAQGQAAKRRNIAVPVLAVLLILTGSAAGLFYFDAGYNETPKTETPADAAPLAVQPAPPETPAAPEVMPTSDTATAAEADPQASRNKPSTSAADTTKKGRVSSKDPAYGQEPGLAVDENTDTVYMGNVKVTENGIEPNTYVDKNGVRRPIPPPAGATVWPGIPKEQYDQMSPEDRQKLAEARRKLMLLQRHKIPVPPTPKR